MKVFRSLVCLIAFWSVLASLTGCAKDDYKDGSHPPPDPAKVQEREKQAEESGKL